MATINGTPFSDNNTVNGIPLLFRPALLGTAAADLMFGLTGDDILDGAAGADQMEGGSGDDYYFVDTASFPQVGIIGDTVIEQAGAGIDTVESSVSFVLGDHVENLTLTGDSFINGLGNALDNRIIGNDGFNTLKGFDGNDFLAAGDGGGTLNGGAGNDQMFGGRGNDLFFVDTLQDLVNEVSNAAGGGIDQVTATLASYTLASQVEDLNMFGNVDSIGVGNTLDNVIQGNFKQQTLRGLEGNDTLSGSAGNDILLGGKGNDQLTGGGDSDRFSFDKNAAFAGNVTDAASGLLFDASLGIDRITDFGSRFDKIRLDRTTFTVLPVSDSLSTAQFASVVNDAAVASQTQAIVYSRESGRLFYNPNGANSGFGGGGCFAVLTGAPGLAGANFQVVA